MGIQGLVIFRGCRFPKNTVFDFLNQGPALLECSLSKTLKKKRDASFVEEDLEPLVMRRLG